jgi:hypothetical protein
MRFKFAGAITILLLVTLALSSAGCTTLMNNKGGQQASPQMTSQSAADIPRDPLLNGIVSRIRALADSLKGNDTRTAWNVTWLNSTTAQIQISKYNRVANITSDGKMTYIRFPSTTAATDYLNGHNAGYSLNRTQYNRSRDSTLFFGPTTFASFEAAAGHPPSIYKVYQETPELVTYYRSHTLRITQFDDVILLEEVLAHR